MLQVSKSDVVQEPFPHVVSREILEPAFFAQLKRDYPTADTFDAQLAMNGLQGSRTGQGFDIYRGDNAYSNLLSSSSAWKEFDAFINSNAFVEKFLELFGDGLPGIGCVKDIKVDNYNMGHIEPRKILTANETTKDKLVKIKNKVFSPLHRGGDTELFSRLDIHRATIGYDKPVHCDRPNRLCTFVLYFCDTEEMGVEGGKLRIFQHKQKMVHKDYPRHPSESDVDLVAEIAPKNNTGVIFPCSNNSYHGVTRVEKENINRDYLYINISATTGYLWAA